MLRMNSGFNWKSLLILKMFEKYYKKYWNMLSKPIPKPKKLFIDPDWRMKSSAPSTKIGKEWLSYLKNVDSVLDYGGGSRLTGKMLENVGWKGSYEIVDMADDAQPEYKSLKEVNKIYDMVICMQVIEHMYFEEFLEFIPNLTSKLKSGEILVIGSDHPAHPGHLWNVEMGHVKAYPYHNLHQYLQMNNLYYQDSKIILQYLDTPRIFNYLLYYLRKTLCSILGISPYLSYIIFVVKK